MASTSTTSEEIVPPSASTSKEKVPCDIFINHHEPDAKDAVALAIYNALRARGFKVFLDLKDLQSEEFFPVELKEAIRSASLHVAVFSPTYAKSPRCLDELSFMLESRKPIIPVFYSVQPTDLRWVAQGKGMYVNAFSEYEEHLSEKLQEWKTPLHKVSFYMGEIIYINE
ncbi:hypothetical protein SUGI_0641590 [Cryptomeria japonica]|uniref:probable 2' cyclic ADP-D-ribose synthase BdTIR n=1 Tax=Cryptomeria japonica TaxID=3369 RepID=UPI00241492AE|nr:probable 2' cyclic ADP-D-ribose synthase BdTIR [Cryptomeria japonica]GLJ31883.1 hypothetical protein SUGI_0641590 [Cryptomeria japonica]